jgi:large subunit ribosomal protein LP1
MADIQTITALAAFILSDCDIEVSAENLTSVITASGNTVPASTVAMYSAFVEKAGGVSKFMAGPGSGGGGGGGAAAAAGGDAPAAVEEKPKEEEVDPMEGGMDMFGGGGGDY